MVDYKKMYYTLIDAVENVLLLLAQDNIDIKALKKAVSTELICGELLCEEIYIQTSEVDDE